MPKKKLTSAAENPDGNESSRLCDAVQSLAGQVEALTDQLQVLREVLDEIREDFQWAMKNDKLATRDQEQWRPITHVTSMPKDPCAENWQINRTRAEDLPPDPKTSCASQAELWD